MKTLLSFVLIACCFSSLAQSNEPRASRSIFKLSPQHFAKNTLKIGFERFNKKMSTSYVVFVSAVADDHSEDAHMYGGNDGYSGLAGEFQFRKYISPMTSYATKRGKNYFQGIYFAGYVQGGSYSGDKFYSASWVDQAGNPQYTAIQVEESIGNYGTGFTIGVQRTLWNILNIDLFVGGGLQLSDTIRFGSIPEEITRDGDETFDDPAYQGILPKIGLHIGVSL